jgi:hypothetical protein
MGRPSHVPISSGLAAWDGEVDDNFNLAFSTPIPISVYANYAALPTASDYDNCLAMLSDEDTLVTSNGTIWIRLGGGMPPRYANFAGLPAAASHLDELAVIEDLDLLCISDGTNWKIMGTQAADIVAFIIAPGGTTTISSLVNLPSNYTAPTVGTQGNHGDITLPTARTGPTVGTAGNHSDSTLPATRTGAPGGTAGNFVTVTDPADTPATADALRDDLVANTIAELRDNQETLKDDNASTLAMLTILQNDVRTFATDAAAVRTALSTAMDSIKTMAEQMKQMTQGAGTIQNLRDNQQAFYTQWNELRTNMRAVGLMA